MTTLDAGVSIRRRAARCSRPRRGGHPTGVAGALYAQSTGAREATIASDDIRLGEMFERTGRAMTTFAQASTRPTTWPSLLKKNAIVGTPKCERTRSAILCSCQFSWALPGIWSRRTIRSASKSARASAIATT